MPEHLSAQQRRRRRRRRRQVAWGALLGVLFFYLLLTLVQGRHRLQEQRLLELRVERLEGELGELRDRREVLERRAGLLRAESLDADLLDEGALRELGFVRPEDLLIVLPEDE
ncbi:MAG: septum formation initiator family protein [Alphaproteobacteria bacterium]|nr:septum formation initiator family protein [Alphaproteobacteria bacterium]MDA7983754.1 septum formation initiator family protein [Alphaproteobacteria bacterium]MDA8002124.1 septum formation initiator family protein [Alphaproteobacteria bacterium]MDA8003555.1 septum formation initiator family protein [Alphaproteobacteria bacterium]MDA8006563.1 septum formation initiator family protein [Alphaproteobacteria bacterium]